MNKNVRVTCKTQLDRDAAQRAAPLRMALSICAAAMLAGAMRDRLTGEARYKSERGAVQIQLSLVAEDEFFESSIYLFDSAAQHMVGTAILLGVLHKVFHGHMRVRR